MKKHKAKKKLSYGNGAIGLKPDALYQAILTDLAPYCDSDPVGPNSPYPDEDVKGFSARQLSHYFLRKMEVDSIEADRAALETFTASNKTCSSWRLHLESSVDEELVGTFKNEVYKFFYPKGHFLCSWEDICNQARVGPGSAVGANGFSFYAKLFSGPLTFHNQSVLGLYRSFIGLFPEWANAELIRLANYGSPVEVDGSNVSLVPKTVDTARMICVEPSLNMFFQLGFGTCIEQRLLDYGINLSLQPDVNKSMAKVGSNNQWFSTIDLSSASDSISLGLLRFLEIPELSGIIHLLRSPVAKLPGTCTPEVLHCVSTMGNGFTFPLQTALFLCILRSALIMSSMVPSQKDCAIDQRNHSVFGDDLIIPQGKPFRMVSRLLSLLGFKINRKKTFEEGFFRESCGGDFYRSNPVRPVFLKRLKTRQDGVVILNLLHEWCARSGINLPSACRMLFKHTSQAPLVPFREGMECGIRVPLSFLEPRLDANGSYLYKRWEPVKRQVRFGDGTVHVPQGHKQLIYNPSGLLLSFLRGEIRNAKITVRHDSALVQPRLAHIPYWDYGCTADTLGKGFSWQQWESAVLTNLNG